MDTFNGTVFHQVDDKGRVRIPSKFLSVITGDDKSEEKNIVKLRFMAGAQGCISVYLPEVLEARIEKLRAVPETDAKIVQAKRKILGSIEKVETDKQGRAVVPDALARYAMINRELVTVGMDDHFEIWAKEVYDKVNGVMSFETAFNEVGFF